MQNEIRCIYVDKKTTEKILLYPEKINLKSDMYITEKMEEKTMDEIIRIIEQAVIDVLQELLNQKK